MKVLIAGFLNGVYGMYLVLWAILCKEPAMREFEMAK